MKSHAFSRKTGKPEERAFSRVDLMAVIGAVALLSFFLTVLARECEDSERAVCLKNVQQIMAAVAMYSTDNSDFLPHPSWGGNLTGPDNWCYATRLATGESAPSANGRSGPDAHTIQLPFYRAGQLAPFLESQRVLVCPTDWREAMSSKGSLYVGRPQKLTSYEMNGTVGGYAGPKAGRIPSGTTYRASDFLPTDILFWEANDKESFYFNDAGGNPEDTLEGLSRRHAAADGEGMGVVGRSGGGVDFVKWRAFTNLQYLANRPNELLCGPGYR
jgi:hypothetical protein